MNRIGYRHPLYGARQTWPRLDSLKACPPPQAANESQAGESDEQSPPLDSLKAPQPPAEDGENTGAQLRAAIREKLPARAK